MRGRKSNLSKSSSKIQKKQVPQELTFMSYYEQQDQLSGNVTKNAKKTHEKMAEPDTTGDSFTPQQRQNLKNAFRYICRLCFKEGKNYQHSISSLLQSHSIDINNRQLSQKLTILSSDSQTISGQRYFKHYLQNMDMVDQIIILEYMLWFLKFKYLRYIRKSNNQRGKRKAMKKDLYLRFKNQIMMPYLSNLLSLKKL